MLCFGAKGGYKTIYELALRNTHTHTNTHVFRGAVGRQPSTLQAARPHAAVSAHPQAHGHGTHWRSATRPDVAAGDWVTSTVCGI